MTRTAARASPWSSSRTASGAIFWPRRGSRWATRSCRARSRNPPGQCAADSRRSRWARWFTTSSSIRGVAASWCAAPALSAQVLAKEGNMAQVRLPSGEVRYIDMNCLATIGAGFQLGPCEYEPGQGRTQALAGHSAPVRVASRWIPGSHPARWRRRSFAGGHEGAQDAMGQAGLGKKTRNNKRTEQVHRAPRGGKV